MSYLWKSNILWNYRLTAYENSHKLHSLFLRGLANITKEEGNGRNRDITPWQLNTASDPDADITCLPLGCRTGTEVQGERGHSHHTHTIKYGFTFEMWVLAPKVMGYHRARTKCLKGYCIISFDLYYCFLWHHYVLIFPEPHSSQLSSQSLIIEKVRQCSLPTQGIL